MARSSTSLPRGRASICNPARASPLPSPSLPPASRSPSPPPLPPASPSPSPPLPPPPPAASFPIVATPYSPASFSSLPAGAAVHEGGVLREMLRNPALMRCSFRAELLLCRLALRLLVCGLCFSSCGSINSCREYAQLIYFSFASGQQWIHPDAWLTGVEELQPLSSFPAIGDHGKAERSFGARRGA